jgi:CDP-diglyceride synthetase
MEIKELFHDINLTPLVIGSAVFTFLVILAINNQLEILLMLSSSGLLYIGYTSKNKIQASILGAVGTIPLFLFTLFFERLNVINGEILEIWFLILFLAIGALCGFIGAYLSKSRAKNIGKIADGKNKSKNKPHKGMRNKK